jgi:general nucleoside transport system permease protein
MIGLDLIAPACLAATPLIIAGLGEAVSQRAGVMNIGLEGYLLTGACAGYAATCLTGNPWIGVAAAITAAAILGLAAALIMVVARADQVVTGTAITLLAAGLTGTAWNALQRHGHAALPANTGIDPVLGPWHLLTLVCPAAIIAVWILLTRTRTGVVLAAVGDDPSACAALAVPVARIQVAAVVAAAAAAGLAGAWLALMRTHGFQPHMSGGRGFLVLCLVILGGWRPIPLAAACLGFGLLEALQQRLQASGASAVISWRLLDLLPWIAALVAITLAGRRQRPPAALGEPLRD